MPCGAADEMEPALGRDTELPVSVSGADVAEATADAVDEGGTAADGDGTDTGGLADEVLTGSEGEVQPASRASAAVVNSSTRVDRNTVSEGSGAAGHGAVERPYCTALVMLAGGSVNPVTGLYV